MKYSEADIEEFLEVCEELRMEAWGYDRLFDSTFHRDVFYKLDEAMRKLRGENNDR